MKSPKTKSLVSRRNLTRFTYESAAFEGWRLSLERHGNRFMRYFSDKQYGGGEKSLAAAEHVRTQLRSLIDGGRLVDGKLSSTTVRKAQKLLAV